MSEALVSGILPAIQAGLAPLGISCEDWRPDVVEVPFAWVRPPNTSRGRIFRWRSGLLMLDVWHYSWEEVQTAVDTLAWLDGHQERGAIYWLESDVRTDEPDAKHAVLTYSVGYFTEVF